MNINCKASAELTANGIDAYRTFFHNLGLGTRRPPLDGNKWSGPLWEMMNIFGPVLVHGSDTPFVGNEITIEV